MSASSFDLNKRPFLIAWETTRACALACRHCRAEAQPKADPDQLTPAQSYELIDQVARSQPAIFIMAGGDPLMRTDCLDLIAYARSQGLRVALSPSGTPRLARTDFHALREAGVRRLSLSLDGASRKTHDRFRGVGGTWDSTMQAFEKAREAGLPVQVNTTLTRHNLSEFDDFVELMLEMAPAMWSLFLIVPTGRGQLHDLPSALAIEDVFERLYHFSELAPFGVKTTEGHHFRRIQLQRGSDCHRPTLGTRDGKGFMFISHTGEVYPSGFLPISTGNVRNEELIDIYRNHELFRQLRDSNQLQGKCGRCEFRDICGGSRARAFGVTGNPFAEEPLCTYQPRARA